MRSPAAPLLPIFRSVLQGRLLALVFAADETFTLAELARRLDAHPATVQREVARLEGSGLVTTRRVGNARVVAADPTSPVHDELAALVERSFGAPRVVAEEFAGLRGAERVLIFGSWAARWHGDRGPPPRDIDVLVIGEPSRRELHSAAHRARRRLGIDVHATARTAREWAAGEEGFLAQLKAGPLLEVPREPGARSA